MVMTDTEIIKNVINTLKSLDVRGYDSMDRLVGCVMVLEKYLKNLETTETKETDDGR